MKCDKCNIYTLVLFCARVPVCVKATGGGALISKSHTGNVLYFMRQLAAALSRNACWDIVMAGCFEVEATVTT